MTPTVSRSLRKVPEVMAIFWIIKVVTTALGEATSDFLVKTLTAQPAVVLGFLVFAAVLTFQLVMPRYSPWSYWLTVAMVAVFGTMAADVLHIQFGVPYWLSSTFYAVVLAIVFILWYRTEGTLSIHTVDTKRRELFYWATVLATFALGTALGDLTANTLQLGYAVSILLFLALMALPAMGYFLLKANPVLTFWTAYVLTRPVGASVADWTSKPTLGGLGFGDGAVALVLAIIFVFLVLAIALLRLDMPKNAHGSIGELEVAG